MRALSRSASPRDSRGSDACRSFGLAACAFGSARAAAGPRPLFAPPRIKLPAERFHRRDANPVARGGTSSWFFIDFGASLSAVNAQGYGLAAGAAAEVSRPFCGSRISLFRVEGSASVAALAGGQRGGSGPTSSPTRPHLLLCQSGRDNIGSSRESRSGAALAREPCPHRPGHISPLRSGLRIQLDGNRVTRWGAGATRSASRREDAGVADDLTPASLDLAGERHERLGRRS